MQLHTYFGIPCLCEIAFFHMTVIKPKNRATLSYVNLEQRFHIEQLAIISDYKN